MPPKKSTVSRSIELQSIVRDWTEGRNIKEGGKEYICEEELFIKGFISPVSSGSIFKECKDGWFAIISSDKGQLYIRVSPVILIGLNLKEVSQYISE